MRTSIFVYVLLFFISYLQETVFAKATSKVTSNKTKKSTVSSPLGYLQSTKHYIASGWVGFNHDLDMFFSGQRYDIQKNRSRILLSYTVHKKESEDLVKAFDFGVKVHLPKLSKKLSVVIQKQRDEIVEARSARPVQTLNTPERGYTAGVKYLFKRTTFFKTSLDSGIRLRMPLDAFIKLKAFKITEFTYVNTFFGQKFIYYRQEAELRSITELNFSKNLSRLFSISQSNALTWTDQSDTFIVRNSLSFSQRIDDENTVGYSMGANATLSPSFYYTSYDAFISYRRSLYEDWLSVTLSGGSTFAKSNDFKLQNFMAFKLDALLR